jgi:CBS domain-containing protein
MMKVEDVLRRKGTRIITVRMRETLATAAMLMKRENIGGLVVKDVCRTEGNIVVGVFSERDLARAIATHGCAALDMAVCDFVKRPLISCALRDPLDAVARLMTEHQVRLLPVLEEHVLVGVISISDVIRDLVPEVDLASRDVVRDAAPQARVS